MSRLGRSQPVQPFATHGFLGNTPANGTLPGRILVVEPDDRRSKTPPLQAVVVVGKFVPPVTVTPPAPVVVDRVDQRVRFRPLEPLVISGALLSVAPPAVTAPPAPYVIPIEERRRLLAVPNVTVGFDDVVPPDPTLVE